MMITELPHMGKKMLVRLGELNMTQSELADKIGMTRQAINRLSDVSAFHSTTTYRIAKALRVPVSYFFEE